MSTMDTCFFRDCDLTKDSSILCLYPGALFQGKGDEAHGSEMKITYSSMLLALVSWKIRTARCPLDT